MTTTRNYPTRNHVTPRLLEMTKAIEAHYPTLLGWRLPPTKAEMDAISNLYCRAEKLSAAALRRAHALVAKYDARAVDFARRRAGQAFGTAAGLPGDSDDRSAADMESRQSLRSVLRGAGR